MVHVRPFWEWGVSGLMFGVELLGPWVLGLGFGVRISAGVFPLPAPTWFSDSEKHFTIAFSKTARRKAQQILCSTQSLSLPVC